MTRHRQLSVAVACQLGKCQPLDENPQVCAEYEEIWGWLLFPWFMRG